MRTSWIEVRNRVSLTVALAVLLVTAGAPIAQATHEEHSEQRPEDTWVVHTTVEAEVVDNYATVKVIAEIENRGPDPEFPFQVRVPDRAMITGLTIERDGKVYNATIEERTEAREQYEQARREHRSAGLVEKHRHASVYAYRVNVEATESLVAELTYEMYLSADRGVYELPLVAPVSGFGYDTGATFDVTVQHRGGVENLWSSPNGEVSQQAGVHQLDYHVGHRSPENDTELDVHYTLEPTDGTGSLTTDVLNGTGYFAHRFRANPDASSMPLDLSLVLDTSGSMSGEKIDQLKDATRQLLSQLGPEDRLHLTFFSSESRTPWSGLHPVDAERTQLARDALDSVVAGGGTRLAGALEAAFEAQDASAGNASERLQVVAVLTDGRASRTNEELRSLAREENDAGANVFGLAFGAEADWSLIHGLAADGEGVASRVPTGTGAEVDLRRFLGAMTTPVLKDVRITYPNHVEAFNASAPVLFAGGEMLVLGTFDANRSTLNASVEANTRDGPVDRTVSHDVEDEGRTILPRLVAYHRIRDLQARLDAGAPAEDLEGEITRLGLKHGFVTDYTSLVLDLPERDQAAEPEGDPSEEASDEEPAGSAGTSGGNGGTSRPAPDRDTSGDTADRPDADGDGVVDANDACPQQAGGTRSGGCPAGRSGSSDGADGGDPTQGPRESDARETPGLAVVAILSVIGALAVVVTRRG